MRLGLRTSAIALALAVWLGAVPGTGGASHGGRKGWEAVRARLKGVPCKAPEVSETKTSKNLRLLTRLPWPSEISTGQVDVEGHLLAGNIFADPGGLMTADISDPLRPRILGQQRLDPGKFTYDVKLTADGKTAVIGFDTNLAFAGVAVVDVRNPQKPRLMSEWVSPRPGLFQNAHMLYTEKIASDHWVFLAPHDSTGAWILKLVGPPGNRRLEYVTQTLPVEGGANGPHDMYVGFDRILKKWVLYTADGYHGWFAFDVSDPSRPTLIDGFPHPSTGYTHTIQAGFVAGRRIVATVEEVGANLLKVYDATNLASPIPVGVWHASSGNLFASEPNLQIVGDYLYVAHYGPSTYVFDLSALPEGSTDLLDLEPEGHYVESGLTIWDVVLSDGLLYLGAVTNGAGVTVVGFGCNRAGDASLTSTG